MSFCKYNKGKKLSNLKGILQGISVGQSLNKTELLYLDTWLRDAQELHSILYCAEILEKITEILGNEVISEDEINNVFLMITEMGENIEILDPDSKLNEFMGFVSGVLANHELNEEVFSELIRRLKRFEDVLPCRELLSLIEDDSSNNDIILQKLKSFSGSTFTETGSSENESMSDIFDELEADYDIRRKSVCFTGGVSGVSRTELKKKAELLGCTIVKDPSKNTNLVVIGDVASKDWVYSSYGRKIEQALTLKKNGVLINIISIEQWLDLASSAEQFSSTVNLDFSGCESLDALFKKTHASLVGMQLYVDLIEVCSDSEWNSLSIHRIRKNGTPLKKSDISLCHVKKLIDGETGEIIGDRTKCWTLRVNKKTTKSFSNQSIAINNFQKELETYLLS